MRDGRNMKVATGGVWKGLHPGMALASMGMVAAFIVFTVLDVEPAGPVNGEVRSRIETDQNSPNHLDGSSAASVQARTAHVQGEPSDAAAPQRPEVAKQDDQSRWLESGQRWYYVSVINVVLLTCLYLALSRHGKVRLGPEGSRPEFDTASWLAMLFGAGIGPSLMYFAVGEALEHLFYNPHADQAGATSGGDTGSPDTDQAGATETGRERAVWALQVSYLHWGLHGWAVYAACGATLAYFAFRKGLPLAPRAALYPIIGRRIYGGAGHTVDILAVLGTVCAAATTIGLGAEQMTKGLEHLFGIESGAETQLAVLGAITALGTAVAVSGIARGVRTKARWNLWIAAAIAAYVALSGPLEWSLGVPAEALAGYVEKAIEMGLEVFGDGESWHWQGTWTMFYWGWWIAWAPCVGMFIARISYGRTLRELILGTMLAPAAIALVWVGVLGGRAVGIGLDPESGAEAARMMEAVGAGDFPRATFMMLKHIASHEQIGWAVAALATLLLASWTATMTSSSTLVVTTILSMGHAHPPQRFRVVWGIGEGAAATALLVAGGLKALQAASISAALPVSATMLIMLYGLLRSLGKEEGAQNRSSNRT